MKKGYPFLYTILLLITCFIASPLIFKQIWNSSKEVEPVSSQKTPVIDISNIDNVDNEDDIENVEVTENLSTDTFVTEQITTEPTTIAKTFIKSDSSYFDDALFIGDSRTVGLYEYGTLQNADYFCDIGLASYKIENEYIDGYTIYDKLSNNEYGKIYVMLGVNEIGNDFDYTMNSLSLIHI